MKCMQLVIAILIQHGYGHMWKLEERLDDHGHHNLSYYDTILNSYSAHPVHVNMNGYWRTTLSSLNELSKLQKKDDLMLWEVLGLKWMVISHQENR